MKPPLFEYAAPRSLDEALSVMAEHGLNAKVLAGGQSLIPAMNFRLAQPKVLVDLNRVPELDYIRREGDRVQIGAMTRQRRVEHSAEIAESIPLLHETMPFIAHPQIRNRGTIGGSLVHADPASELPVVAVALDAEFTVSNKDGATRVPAAAFFYGMFMVAMNPGDVLTEVSFPVKADRTGYAFTEVSRRHGDYAMMGIAAVLGLDEAGKCSQARLVYLNAGDKPVSAEGAAALLVGATPSEEGFKAAAEKASTDEMDPYGSIHASADYQRHLARVLTVRALKTAYARAQNH